MSGPVILLVEADEHAAQLIRAAFERRLLPRPLHVTRGEDAVLWVGANACDACVLSGDLPGIDALEAFARIRQRQPALPVVMLSGRGSEDLAVAAFRAGVADYVPKKPGYQDVVADIVQHLVRPASSHSHTGTAVASDIPEQLMRMTYQNRLRAIGRQLDLYQYQSINLMEVGGGMLVRATMRGSRTPEALEFLDEDFAALLRGGFAARGEGERPRGQSKLLPTGYEDFLRALGYRLDQSMAEAVSVTELDAFIAVGGVARIDASGHTTVGPMHWLLYTDDIAFLLDEAYRRRAPGQEAKGSTLGRMFGRRQPQN